MTMRGPRSGRNKFKKGKGRAILREEKELDRLNVGKVRTQLVDPLEDYNHRPIRRIQVWRREG